VSDHKTLRLATVIVGASRGIGRAIATIAAGESGPVVLAARSREHLKTAADDVRAAGGEPFIVELDLTSAVAAARLETILLQNGLACDVLVNSAGYGLRGAATIISAKEQLGIIDVNIRALSELTLHFLPGMLARKRGGVINLASIASFTPGPNMAMYYASKSFVRSFSEALNAELRLTGVTVTCVAPGPVETEFLKRSGAGRATLFRILPRQTPEYVAREAWRGFRSGRRLVIPGISAKVAAIVMAVLPTSVLLSVVGRLQRRSSDLCPCGSGRRFDVCCGESRFRLAGRTLRGMRSK
jgi:short-subunit dehydrogenase